MKSKADKLDVDKLVSVPAELSKLSDVVKMMLLKRTNMINWLKRLRLFRILILVIQSKKTDCNTKINENKKNC